MNPFEHGLLKYLKPEQLQKIQSVKIGIGGAGGLGSNVAMMLVRTGFKNFEILDFDVIDASNLNRQQYFIHEIGLSKVDVTQKRLLDINPDLNIMIHRDKWIPENGAKFFKDCDVIVEAFDQVDNKYRFAEFYQDKAKYLVSGVGMAGLFEKQPMTIRRIGNMFIVGDTSTDSHQGHPPMAPRVTQCAGMMAEVVLDLTLDVKIK